MERTIQIDGKDVLLRCTAKTPIIYHALIHRDLLVDFDKLQKNKTEDGGVDIGSLETFLNIAYVMAKHADPSIPDTPEEWLDNFSTFSIYQVLPSIIELWGLNVQTDIQSKKNLAKVSG